MLSNKSNVWEWSDGTFYDGPWQISCKIDMGNPHGFFYDIWIKSYFHIARRCFAGKGFKRTIRVNYKYLLLDYWITDGRNR